MTMVSEEAISRSMEPTSSPRISFSAEFFVSDLVSMSPNHGHDHIEKGKECNGDFEFLSANRPVAAKSMLTADELFFEGKLLPFWQVEQTEKLNKITLTPKMQVEDHQKEPNNNIREECRVTWVMDDDPSPRPPTCNVLWKELLRLKKHRSSSLSSSPSLSSSSSTSSSLSSTSSANSDEGMIKERKGVWDKEKHVKRIKKGLERTKSASFRMRPMVSVPICTHNKNNALSPMLHLKKGNVER
ncbi:hypothetical protein Syun_029142 [Stephania yunnanensis]|uniref:Uncharacterized protein n=1 Tax=Stephania yunnanensis TaxID=152371 RepID=A0AAP0E824_9MAGN